MLSAIAKPEMTVCCLTPHGPGAVAVLQLELGSADLVSRALAGFQPGSSVRCDAPIQDAPVNRILFGQWRGEDVLLIRTSATRWELQCHGGAVAVRRILADLSAAGACVVDGAGRGTPDVVAPLSVDDRIAVAVQRSLALCRTRQAADWILRQLDGRLSEPLTQLSSANPTIRSGARSALLRHARFMNLLLRPARVGLFGPPNAGKSSLLNALCGLTRTIVSPVAGTTRDPVEAETQAGGRVLCITDTAGLHDSPGSLLEAEGIQRTRELVSECDAACILIPADQPLEDLRIIAEPFLTCPVRILIRSRCDLAPEVTATAVYENPARALRLPPREPSFTEEVRVSAVTGEGLEELREVLVRSIFPPEPDSATPLPLPGLFQG
jgi:tRNA modification GTPase